MLKLDTESVDVLPSTICSQPRASDNLSGNIATQRSEGVRIAVASARSGRVGKISPKRAAAVRPETVLQSFNTWAFKREQPADPELMLQLIAASIEMNRPVPFVLYWGKGPRSGIDQPDINCLDYLVSLARRVQDVYEPGVTIKLIFTDTHARLNGHSNESIAEYFGAIDAAARQRGFESCWLSELVDALESDPTTQAHDVAVPEDTLLRLEACAAKWYRGEGTAQDGAVKYYRMSLVEKRAVETAFPGSIFVTFNGSEFRGLFPDQMPIFYMYSLRRGFSVKPWFLPAPEVCSAAESALG